MHFSPNIIQVIKSRRIRWVGQVARVEQRRDACMVLGEKPEGRTPLGRPRHRWEDDIKMYLQEVEWGGMDWIDRAQDKDRWRAVVNVVTEFQVS
jgi:hypothetical protein